MTNVMYDYIGLKEKLEMYFRKEITLNELGNFCEAAYYATIKGGYLFLSSLLVYPMLKRLYRINVVPNNREDNWPCSLSEIDSVYEILSGRKNAVVAVTVGISASVSSAYIKDYDKKKEQYANLKTMLLDYLDTGMAGNVDALMLECIFSEIKRSDTILDYIENHISAYLVNIGIEGRQLKLINPLGLYREKRESVEDIIKRVVLCIDCYMGNKDISMQISYTDGIPALNAFLFN